MVSSEEKRKLTKELISLFGNKSDVEEIQYKLHEMLLNDTNGGKLYKFRTFDKKGYSLDSLKNGTLYCSKPSAFNDPFDCKIGITLLSMLETAYRSEYELLIAIFDKISEIANGTAKLTDCTNDEQRIINKLLANKNIEPFISNTKDSSSEEMINRFNDNPYILVEILETILSDKSFKSVGNVTDSISRIFKNIAPNEILAMSQDTCTYEDFARANGITDDADEIQLTMLIGEKIYPELAPSVKEADQAINEIEKTIANMSDNLFLIGCLCTDYKNRLMWSHYADSHKGFCVEYDFSGKDKLAFINHPFPIHYSECRPLIPWDAAVENTTDKLKETSTEIMLGLLAKDSAWEYENEWRILISSNESPNLKMPKITCIYLGTNISEINKRKILRIAKERNILVKQMKIDRGTYDLHAEIIEI